MTDTRTCKQCGTLFTPRREHARFCSGRCRVAWNRENGDPAVKVNALQWSISAMSDTTERLARVSIADQPRAFVLIGEAVWWVTIVDATLVRYHLVGAYDAVLADRTPAERRLIEGTLAGLRFVRNRISDEVDLAEFIEPSPPCPGADEGPVTGWTWKSVPEPALASSPRARSWEMTRYRAYQAQLAGHTIGEIFGRAVAFLELTAANAPSITDISAHAAS